MAKILLGNDKRRSNDQESSSTFTVALFTVEIKINKYNNNSVVNKNKNIYYQNWIKYRLLTLKVDTGKGQIHI